MDGDEVRKELDHDRDDSVEAGHMNRGARQRAIERRYRDDCVHLIDCLTSPYPLFWKSSFSSHMPAQRVQFNGSSNQSAHRSRSTVVICYTLVCHACLSEGALATTYENLNHRLSYTDPISRIHAHMHIPDIVCPRHAPELDSIPMLWIISPGDL